MSNYHLEVKNISRGKGHSLARQINYITGRSIHDTYLSKTYSDTRRDVLYINLLLPRGAPGKFHDLNCLCSEVDYAERRWDARTARSLTCSLPNELSLPEWTQIVKTFVERNFLEYSLRAIVAIHEGKNLQDPQRDNPHVHIIVPTRSIGPNGFDPKKDRTLNQKARLCQWRAGWAQVQNQAYEHSGLPIRVSHESLERQGIYDREPTIHLSHIDWQREMAGERTERGEKKREIERRNRRTLERNLEREHPLTRSR